MATEIPKEKMWSTEKAARFLGVSPVRVRQFCQEGRLGEKVGNSYVIRDSELKAFKRVERPHGAPKRNLD